MEHRWSLQGCHANWTLTLRIEPIEGAEQLNTPAKEFDGLADHFNMAVNYFEFRKELEQVETCLR